MLKLSFPGVVTRYPFSRMGLARVDEDESRLVVPVSNLIEQRTLCRAIGSGERSEFHY